MDVTYQGEKDECETPDCENEYQLEIKIQSLVLENDGKPEDLTFVFVFGDIVNRMTGEGGFDDKTEGYTVHSTPIALAEKLLGAPIMISVVSSVDLKPLGKKNQPLESALAKSRISPGILVLELSECFCNAVKCRDFRTESIKKVFDLGEGKQSAGRLSLLFSVTREVQNSYRHRRFYTEATQENLSRQVQDV